MIPEELKALGEKVVHGSATPEEQLAFLRELNNTIGEMRRALSNLKKKEK